MLPRRTGIQSLKKRSLKRHIALYKGQNDLDSTYSFFIYDHTRIIQIRRFTAKSSWTELKKDAVEITWKIFMKFVLLVTLFNCIYLLTYLHFKWTCKTCYNQVFIYCSYTVDVLEYSLVSVQAQLVTSTTHTNESTTPLYLKFVTAVGRRLQNSTP